MPPNHVCQYTLEGVTLLTTQYKWALVEHKIEQLSPKTIWGAVTHYQTLQRKIDGKIGRKTTKASLFEKAVLFGKIAMNKNLGESQWFHFKKAA
jgi:hypothetical protein